MSEISKEAQYSISSARKQINWMLSKETNYFIVQGKDKNIYIKMFKLL